MTFSKAGFAMTLGLGLMVAAVSGPAMAQDSEMSHGEYVARLGNCVACHSTPDGKPFAGGLKMNVPMLGNIYTTNITPDKETGIGNYSYDDFARAMREGVAKDGHHLYPAMPYTSYAKISDEDMHALYDYFMHEVTPVNQPNKANEIPGWKSPRWPLAIWNMLFHDDDPYEAKADQSAAWNRGAYLVQGLGHCGACHTPRGIAFEEKGLDESSDDYLSGAPLDHWSAASLRGDINSGLGRMSEDDIFEFLKTGKNRFGTAFGTMVEVVNNSTAFMTDDDLHAIATYLKTLPANKEKNATPYQYDGATAEALANFDFKEPGSATYYQFCVSCHQYDGSGQNMYMPALAGNPVVLDEDPDSLVNIILNGSLRVVADGRPEHYDMPYFRVLLDDEDIANVTNYIRKAWGNKAMGDVTSADVAKIRMETDPTRNDDAFVLRMK